MKFFKSEASVYLIATLIITSIAVLSISQFELSRSLYRYTVVIPGVLALLFLSFIKSSDISFEKFFRQFMLTNLVLKWLLLSLILYTLISYLATSVSSILFEGNFELVPIFRIPICKVWLIFVLAFFEEIGWRGFALPQLLKNSSFIKSSIFVGVVWALWHFPGYLVGFGAPNDIPFLLFSTWVIASSFIFSWLYIKSNGNIWTSILLHFGANMALQLYPIMPNSAGTKATFYVMTILIVFIASCLLLIDRLSLVNHQTPKN